MDAKSEPGNYDRHGCDHDERAMLAMEMMIQLDVKISAQRWIEMIRDGRESRWVWPNAVRHWLTPQSEDQIVGRGAERQCQIRMKLTNSELDNPVRSEPY